MGWSYLLRNANLFVFHYFYKFGSLLKMENHRDMQIWLHKFLHVDVTMDVIVDFNHIINAYLKCFFVDRWHITNISNITRLKLLLSNKFYVSHQCIWPLKFQNYMTLTSMTLATSLIVQFTFFCVSSRDIQCSNFCI